MNEPPPSATARRKLAGACAAHVLHDGYTDQLYALLPVWQGELGLTYAGLAALRVLYYGTMGALQVPGARLLGKTSARTTLALATSLSAVGYLVMSLPGGVVVLGAGLVLAGIGSSLQHPRSSTLVTSAYGKAARGPLGIYNFSGDLGKAGFPAVVALLLPLLAWRSVVALAGLLGLGVALLLLALIPRDDVAKAPDDAAGSEARDSAQSGRGFGLLLAIGALDTAPRMGYLLFLPFLVRGKGGAETSTGLALALLFLGGAFGKAVCGWLGARLGVVATVITTEIATATLILATLWLPLGATYAALPLLGLALNGTSSVLYGTVPDLAPRGDTGRAFALFYTGNIVVGGVAPIAYGLVADHAGKTMALVAAAVTALAIVPLVVALRPRLVA